MFLQALPYIVLNAFLFGSTLIASRFSVGQYEPLTYITLRLLIASSIHLGVYRVQPARTFPTDKRLWSRVSVFALFGTVINLVTIATSLRYISSGTVSILLTTGPAVTALAAALFLREERLNLRQWTGVVLALSGAALMALSGQNGLAIATSPIGYVLAGVGILSGSSMTVYARRTLQGYDSFDAATARSFIALLIVLPVDLLFAGFDFSRVNVQGVGAVIYAGLIGTFGGYVVQMYVIQRFGAIAAAMVPYVIPLITATGGVLVLGEQITPTMIGASLIILCGITLVQQQRSLPLITTRSEP